MLLQGELQQPVPTKHFRAPAWMDLALDVPVVGIFFH